MKSSANNRPRVYTIRNLTPTNNNNNKKKTEKIDSIVFFTRNSYIIQSRGRGYMGAVLGASRRVSTGTGGGDILYYIYMSTICVYYV